MSISTSGAVFTAEKEATDLGNRGSALSGHDGVKTDNRLISLVDYVMIAFCPLWCNRCINVCIWLRMRVYGYPYKTFS